MQLIWTIIWALLTVVLAFILFLYETSFESDTNIKEALKTYLIVLALSILGIFFVCQLKINLTPLLDGLYDYLYSLFGDTI